MSTPPRARAPRTSSTWRPALRRALAWLIALLLFPGAGEAVTDLGHLLVDGDTVHDPIARDAVESAAHDHPASDEHGCSGLFHTCHCCASPVVIAAAMVRTTAPAVHGAPSRVHPRSDDRARDAHAEPPFRPPAA